MSKIPLNFKLQGCDERHILGVLHQVVSKFRYRFDPESDGKIVTHNTRNEYLGKNNIVGQLKYVARRSREAMVIFALQICAYLAGTKKLDRYPKAGAYFLGCAVSRQRERLLKYPRNPDAIIDEVYHEKRSPEFYQTEFWSSEVIISWIVVHVIQEWYDIDLDSWAEEVAEEIDQSPFAN